MEDVNCPYCGFEQEIDHDDGFGYDECGKWEQECVSCEKVFIYTTYISFSYEVSKADCLNGEKHSYEKTNTFPAALSRMKCVDCGHERKATEKEMESVLVA